MIELIPAIDIIDGKCVGLTQGDYLKKKSYDYNPLEVAQLFESAGIRRLHIVDLDGAKSNHIVNIDVLKSISKHTNITIDFGGGVKSQNDLEIAFESGADIVTIGSLAVTNPQMVSEWIHIYGPERFIIGADVKNGMISINGWQEEGEIKLFPFIKKYMESGIKNVLCTDISKDGMLKGPAISLYQHILSEFPDLHLIASGGVGSVNDIRSLNNAGIASVVFGKAFYEGYIQLDELSEFINASC